MKSICFTPVDNEMQTLGKAIKILNDFKALGFTKREVFVEVVLEIDPHYKEFGRIQKLMNFWSARVKDENMNKDLENVIAKLKSE